MLIRAGFEIGVRVDTPTPMVMNLCVHPDRSPDIRRETGLMPTPATPIELFQDRHGNRSARCLVPAGGMDIRYDALIEDSGDLDAYAPDAPQVPVEKLPNSALVYLLASRYCETEHLSDLAWRLFGGTEPGWARVQAICDYVHERLSFSYGYARATRTACQAHDERVGVCRDFAHLAVALCRCMNIPARYVNGYLGDIGVPPDPAPMDFNAWFEAFLGDRWYTFDARHNKRRIGRIVVSRGRDATDIPLMHTFGPHRLETFNVWTYEAKNGAADAGLVKTKHSLVEPWHSPFWSANSRRPDPRQHTRA